MKNSHTYHFTLVLKNVDEHTINLEDSLYECGCDDALINYRDGAVYLDFDRDATSFEDAVISAIKHVKSSSIYAEVASVAPDNLVTAVEIAKRLNVSRQTVSLWIKKSRRKLFPHPIMRLTEASPLWNWSDVVRWLYSNKLITDESLIEKAEFISNINAALEECDSKIREMRYALLKKIERRDAKQAR